MSGKRLGCVPGGLLNIGGATTAQPGLSSADHELQCIWKHDRCSFCWWRWAVFLVSLHTAGATTAIAVWLRDLGCIYGGYFSTAETTMTVVVSAEGDRLHFRYL